jgi:hypothetical protein
MAKLLDSSGVIGGKKINHGINKNILSFLGKRINTGRGKGEYKVKFFRKKTKIVFNRCELRIADVLLDAWKAELCCSPLLLGVRLEENVTSFDVTSSGYLQMDKYTYYKSHVSGKAGVKEALYELDSFFECAFLIYNPNSFVLNENAEYIKTSIIGPLNFSKQSSNEVSVYANDEFYTNVKFLIMTGSKSKRATLMYRE